MKRILFSILLLGTLPFAMSLQAASTVRDGNLQYTILDESARTAYVRRNVYTAESSVIDITISPTVTINEIEYNVTTIYASAFNGCALKNVTIPSSIISIGAGAFINCGSLKTVVFDFQHDVTIGASAFEQCGALKSVTFPQGLTTIPAELFKYCANISSITIPESVTTVSPNAFNLSTINSITIECETPPSVSSAFNVTTAVTLHVPCDEAKDLYSEAVGWRDFTIDVTEPDEISVSESSDNSLILTTYDHKRAKVVLTRTIREESYNSICLPFAVSAAEVTRVFGDDCDIEELTATEVTASSLTLNFTQRTAMEAGKPYLIQPQATVTNPTFQNVRIVNSAETVSVDDVDFAGVFSPTTLAADEHILFLGANNTLSPSLGGDISGLRAYFVLTTEGARKAAAKGIKPNFRQPAQPTELPLTNDLPDSVLPVKRLENGRIVLIRGGFIYTLQGQLLGEEVRR